MHLLRFALPLAVAAATTAAAFADTGPTVVASGQEHWVVQPGNYSMAVLYGNPSRPGFYVIRLKVPPNWSFPAHYHPMRENATVISGTFYVGMGTKFNKDNVTAYHAGTFASLPPKMPHYALTKSSGAVIQLEGDGPFQETTIKK